MIITLFSIGLTIYAWYKYRRLLLTHFETHQTKDIEYIQMKDGKRFYKI